ncbi:chorismate lyase [Gilvimarinus sp. DA14]|uniref:chorismate--pyruvate lyase family protein n=1 Tax=Gilvimarinus sp. DA14 TaxID=2956798 RepID=UPI003530D0FE
MPPTKRHIARDRRFARQGWGLWRPAGQQPNMPKTLRPWLLDSGSLTAKLRRLSVGQLSVEILRQSWGRPRLSEARALGCKPNQACLIREVVLQGPGQMPWVYARSLFPAPSLTGALRHLRQLDNRPLGGYLFSHPNLGRSPISIAAIPPYTGVPDQLQKQQLLWGRRSIFGLYGRHILVSEVFLPGFVTRVSGDQRP